MADEPSNGELGRSIGEVKAMVATLVSTREYAEFQRYVTHLLGELAKEIANERAAREKDIANERAAREKDIAKEQAAREEGFREIRAEKATGWHNGRLAFLTTVGTVVAALIIAALSGWLHPGGH